MPDIDITRAMNEWIDLYYQERERQVPTPTFVIEEEETCPHDGAVLDSLGLCTMGLDCGQYDDDDGEDDQPCPCDCGNMLSEGCYYEHNDEPSDDIDGVNNWDYRPRLNFHGDGPVFMGFELELAAEQSVARGVEVANESYSGSLVYLKDDGSISPRGFEFVTHPMTYDWALQNFNWSGLSSLRSVGMNPNSSCGLHVHVNREGFSGASHTYRWLKFMYRNQVSMKKLARREDGGYSTFGDGDTYGRMQRKIQKDIATKKDARGGQRYAAVNATNEHTFEVRMFASTLNKVKLQAALGLVNASVEYTRLIKANDILRHNAWTMRAFMDWVRPQEKYESLTKEYDRLCVS